MIMRLSKKARWLLASALCLFLSLTVGIQAAPLEYENVILVQGGGSNAQNGEALRAAINKANANATTSKPWLIKLEPGEFESISINLPDITASVSLEGSGENATTILTDFRLRMDGNQAMIADLTVDNTAAGNGFAISIGPNTSLVIKDSTIIAGWVTGVILEAGGASSIEGSTITNDGSLGTGSFVAVDTAQAVDITHSRIVTLHAVPSNLEVLQAFGFGGGSITISHSFMDEPTNSVDENVTCRAIATPSTFLASDCPGED